MPKKLVIGASGFLGSHVTRRLVEGGADVRVMVRTTSSTRGIDDLAVERCHGDIFDDEALRSAMTGCDVVYYCVVDARMWLRDPAPLFRTNVEGLRHVLEAATRADLTRFVFTSTAGTLACSPAAGPGLVTETDPVNWNDGGPYIDSRVAAENLVLEFARDRSLPAVAMCISTTYGPGDWQPTPHGRMLGLVAAGKVPFALGYSAEVVGITDAADAMLLAAEHGRPGERYIVSESWMSNRAVAEIAAAAAGVRPPRFDVPMSALMAMARVNDAAARVLRRDLMFAAVGMRIVARMPPLDHSKARRELGWTPQPTERAIADAARFFAAQNRAS